ncbi:ATP-grasp domain-containing protein [Streptomyces sp. AC536]|uniref:ATP-grasp domain-containing protein n=1 Tax=Streptomyces buecherae TaxID=2763006 RepID=UPI00164DFBB2|nr:ATP-grasp domain-containing protein [Streptomyces buecherae]MBC3984144.1 ATP-grasp domain-containing protein [Streptomyces buecherae]QNJ43857.1 ATP-grasp domain-containing protein [Streptomyces buecherae]
MGHLLMIESWVGSMSRLLPRAVRESGHEFTFLTRDLHHYLRNAPEGASHPLLGARNVLTWDTNDTQALLPQVERLHAALGFDGVITSCDYYLPAVAEVAARLGLPGAPPGAVADACRKDATRRVLHAAGVPGPRFAVCTDWAQAAEAAREIGYPLVIKPVDLCAGMFVRRVDDEGDLSRAYRSLADFPVNARGQRRAPQVLLEELLEGPEVSVETVSFDGKSHVVGVTDKSVGGAPAFIETGHMFPAALDAEATTAAASTAQDALAALGLDHVVAHTEIKLTAHGPRVVEVNPRPAGNRITELVRHVTGIDLAAAFVDVALGNTPDLAARDTGLESAAIGFLVPETAGVLEAIEGADGLAERPGVLEAQLAGPGATVKAAGSNNEYLGHVMAADPTGGGARARVEELLGALRPRVATR